MEITTASLDALSKGFNAAFLRGFGTVNSTYSIVAMEVPSTTSAETYGWMKDLPDMKEWIGERQINNLETAAAEIVNKPWEHTLGVKGDAIADDKIGIYGTMFSAQGEVAASHPDRLVWGLLPKGFTTKGFDGKNFFSANHEGFDDKGKSIAWSNLQDGAGPPWFLMDLRRVYMKPLIFQKRLSVKFTKKIRDEDDNVFHQGIYLYGCNARYNAGLGFHQLAFGSKAELNATNYEAARTALASQCRQDGNPLGIVGTHLVVGTTNDAKARSLLLKELLAGGESNIWRNSAELVTCPWLR